MALQWELIIFTTLIAWSAGLFASQCVLALKGEASQAQTPAWLASAALLVVGGIAVFFHLEHWTRIFNGFGHLSSGITQELIAIVILAVIAVIYLAFLRKGSIPAWIAIAGIAASLVLLFVMAHSYMMAARPAWDSFAWVLAIIGNACAFGPLTLTAIVAVTQKNEEDSKVLGLMNVAGAGINAVGTVIYVAAAALATSAFSVIDFYYDPTHPSTDMVNIASVNPFAGGNMMITTITLICVLAVLALAFVGRKQNKWMPVAAIAAGLVLVGSITVRVLFYQMGASVFMFF